MSCSSASNAQASAIRRILREWREIVTSCSDGATNDRWRAHPVNPAEPYEWHFTMRGPVDTPFAGGIYHGRLILPVNYPMAPPALYFLTVNGRFEVHKQVCLSATNFHPESWQPAWGISSILEALHAFFPTPAEGAVHSLDWSDAVRRDLARLSSAYVCPTCRKSNLELITEVNSSFDGASPAADGTDEVNDESKAMDERESPDQDEPKESKERELEGPVPPPVYDEAAEFIKRQPTSSMLNKAAASSSPGFMGFAFHDRGGTSVFIFVYWLIYFLWQETHSMLRRSRLLREGWASLVGPQARLSNFLPPLIASLIFLICLGGILWSSSTLLGFALKAFQETFFLNSVPFHRVGQQTTAGVSFDLSIAERHEDFPISKWLVRFIFDQ